MNYGQAEQDLTLSLQAIYDRRESRAIADQAMEFLLRLNKVDRIIRKDTILGSEDKVAFERIRKELMGHRPLQYVIGEAWFMGMKFSVDERVLIPRPETEELVGWALEMRASSSLPARKILDMGTGSGCIAVAIKKNWPEAEVHACDLSEDALKLAEINATENQVGVHFFQLDFLHEEKRNALPAFDLLVSNPPYIPLQEKRSLEKHVVDFEPRQALFVSNDRPLVFYEALAHFGKTHLAMGGSLLAEIHEPYAEAIQFIFSEAGFRDIVIRKDLSGRQRMIKATRLP